MAKPLYSWARFLTSFKKIKRFAVYTNKEKDASVVLSFHNPEQVKIFMFWLMILGKVEPYEAAVYLHDTMPEELENARRRPGKDKGLVEVK